jgi:cbb3-type cytochrome oxidase subunit 3
MNVRKLLLLTFILVLLGAYFYFYEIKKKGAEKRAEEAAKKVFSLNKDDIRELRLKRIDQTIVCQKEDDHWVLKEPLQAAADTNTIETVLNSLLNLSKERVIEESPSDLSLYGLKDPEIEGVLVSKGGAEKRESFYLGNRTPTGSFIYMRKADKPEVFLVPYSLEADLSKGVYDFRDKTVAPIDPQEIKKIEFIRDKQSIICELQDSGPWKIIEPINYRADKKKLEELLDKVKGLKVKEFIEEDPKELSVYGLDNPTQELVFWNKKEKDNPVRLFLGKQDDEKKGIYAKQGGKKNVFLIEAGFITYLPKEVNELRDPYLLSFDPQKVIKVALQTKEEHIICTKSKGDLWQLESPIKSKANNQEVDNLLDNLKEIKVKEFVSDQPNDLEKYHLASTKQSFSIWLEGQQNPRTLLLGKEDSHKNGVYVKIGDQPHIFLISPDDVKKISKKAFDLRDKSLLSFEVNDIIKISLLYPEKEILLERQGENWNLLKPKKMKAKYIKVLDLLWELNGLEFKAIASEQGDKLSEYGLDNPQLQIRLWKGEGSPWDTLFIGASTPDNQYLYAKTASHPAIYKILPDLLKKIPKELTAFQE